MDSRLRGNDKYGFARFVFLLAAFGRRPKSSASIIGATCAFDAKIYKIVDGNFNVSSCGKWNKKIFKLFYFCFQLPSLLVEMMPSHSRRFSGNFRKNRKTKGTIFIYYFQFTIYYLEKLRKTRVTY
jgi:hypothetical protein